MNFSLRLHRARRFLTLVLLIAAIIAAVVVWVDRGGPAAIALDNLSGEAVHSLVAQQHDDGDRDICGVSTISDIEIIRDVAHGLDSTSEIPPEVAAELELYGASLEDYEQRHFDTYRLLLISWDPTSKDLGEGYGAELGSVYELLYVEDENSIGWAAVYRGSVLECPPDWPD